MASAYQSFQRIQNDKTLTDGMDLGTTAKFNNTNYNMTSNYNMSNTGIASNVNELLEYKKAISQLENELISKENENEGYLYLLLFDFIIFCSLTYTTYTSSKNSFVLFFK